MFRRCFLDVVRLSECLSFSDAWEHYPRFNEIPSRSLIKELFVTHYVTPDGFIFGDVLLKLHYASIGGLNDSGLLAFFSFRFRSMLFICCFYLTIYLYRELHSLSSKQEATMLHAFRHGRTGPKVFLYFGQRIVSHCSATTSTRKSGLLPCLEGNKRGGISKAQKEHRQFQSLFGCSPEIVAEIWYRIAPRGGEVSLRKGAEPCHLLWALLFMKVYANEDVLCSMVGGVDKKTFCFWTRYFIRIIATRVFNKEVSGRLLLFATCVIQETANSVSNPS